MKIIFLFSCLLFQSVGFCKIAVDDLIYTKGSKEKSSQSIYLNLAQSRFNDFINCQKTNEKRSGSQFELATCLNEQFVNSQSSVTLINYIRWFQSDTRVSVLYTCSNEIIKVAIKLKKQPKDIVFCVDALLAPDIPRTDFTRRLSA